MLDHPKVDSAISYAVGFGAMSVPALLQLGTTILSFLTALGGFIIVLWRLKYDLKKDKPSDPS